MAYTNTQTAHKELGKVLTPGEIQGYRQWLAELDEEAHTEGGSCNICDAEVWEYFDTKSDTGRQVYDSFTDEELLEVILASSQDGSRPKLHEIYCVYRKYIKLRFGGWINARENAREYRLFKQIISKWPTGWYMKVSPQPLVTKLRESGVEPDRVTVELFESLCREARKTGCPPYISTSVRKRINRVYNCSAALELMGIPSLLRAERQPLEKKLLAHWAEEYRQLRRQRY